MRAWYAGPLLLLALAACGDPNAPGSLSGAWDYRVSTMKTGDETVRCSVTDMVVGLSQVGSSFSGNTNGGIIECYGVDIPRNLPRMTVINGRLEGNAVTFAINYNSWTHTGALMGNAISGTTIMYVDVVHVLTGTFTLVRQ